mmetsp:Transcript_23336/g.51042  ORF Transcript_23336/g.51042 Transcript_23336/m.51042 type:complete len:218 (-) Transcript_23336:963-1616(-)
MASTLARRFALISDSDTGGAAASAFFLRPVCFCVCFCFCRFRFGAVLGSAVLVFVLVVGSAGSRALSASNSSMCGPRPSLSIPSAFMRRISSPLAAMLARSASALPSSSRALSASNSSMCGPRPSPSIPSAFLRRISSPLRLTRSSSSATDDGDGDDDEHKRQWFPAATGGLWLLRSNGTCRGLALRQRLPLRQREDNDNNDNDDPLAIHSGCFLRW